LKAVAQIHATKQTGSGQRANAGQALLCGSKKRLAR